jgi:hypothetical protein
MTPRGPAAFIRLMVKQEAREQPLPTSRFKSGPQRSLGYTQCSNEYFTSPPTYGSMSLDSALYAEGK